MSTALKEECYAYSKAFYWMRFSNSESGDLLFKKWEEDERDQLHIQRLDCDWEDQQALYELNRRWQYKSQCISASKATNS